MGIFSTGVELREEGLNYFNQGDYEKAGKIFAKAIEKEDYDSIVLLADAKWKLGAKSETIEHLKRYADDETQKISDAIKIEILRKLMEYDQRNFKEYKYRAAGLDDFSSVRYVFDVCIAKELFQDAAIWAKKVLLHEKCDAKTRYEVLNAFEYVFTRYQASDNNTYHLINQEINGFTRLYVLKSLTECEAAPSFRKGEAYYEIGRISLVKAFYKKDADRVEYYKEDAAGVWHAFNKAWEFGYIPALYYLAILYEFGIECAPNHKMAMTMMDKLFENENKFDDLKIFETVNKEDIKAFWDYLSYKSNIDSDLDTLDSYIGHDGFKKRIHQEVNLIKNKYDVWGYHSNFRRFEQPRKMEHKIFILNGKVSNCKKTIIYEYTKILHRLYKNYTNYGSVWREISTINIDSTGGLENKINYIRGRIADTDNAKSFKFLYFDQPYNISDPHGENYYHIIMKNLIREVLQSTDKLLFLAGDGDLIIDELKALDVAEYFYIDDIINFNGYSEKEVIEFIDSSCRKNQTDYGIAVKNEIERIVRIRNAQFQANINYDEINEIRRVLDNVYNSLSAEYRNDVRNYEDAFKLIETRLGIEKISESNMEAAIAELEGLIGLGNIKEEVYKIIDSVRINNIRKERGLQPMFRSLNMVFYGNPGTGKTTVARLMGKILKELGVLEKGHMVEKSRGDLVSQYWGATAGKTKEILKQAVNGVLFIDEAYTLTNNQGGSSKDYGQEAVEEILKFMSDKEGQIVVIVAGYKNEMDEFLRSNPGLDSRFNTKIEFEDYTDNELYEIFERLCKKNDFDIEEGAQSYILEYFRNAINDKGQNFGNARFVGGYFTEVTRRRSSELANRMNDMSSFSDEELRLLPVNLFRNFEYKNN